MLRIRVSRPCFEQICSKPALQASQAPEKLEAPNPCFAAFSSLTRGGCSKRGVQGHFSSNVLRTLLKSFKPLALQLFFGLEALRSAEPCASISVVLLIFRHYVENKALFLGGKGIIWSDEQILLEFIV